MSDRIHVATRKGLFTLARSADGRWSIAEVAFLGVPVSMSLFDRRTGHHYAALDYGHFGTHLHRSEDGKNWQEVAVPTFPAGATVPQRMPETGDEAAPGSPPTKPASLSEIWALEPGSEDQPGRLWAGTIPGGLFRSDDHGQSWQLVEALWDRPERQHWFGGGKDDAGIHSIAVDPRDSRRLTIGISCGGVWKSDDEGQTWRQAGQGLRAEYMPPAMAYEPNAQDPHRLVSCPAAPDGMWIQHHNGIFRSADGGENWDEIKDVEPAVFGFAVAVHPQNADTAWFVPGVKDETRVPVDGRLVVTRTRDGGQSFEQLSTGPPPGPAYDIVFRHALDVDTSGNRLAMGSTTGNFWVSDDGGDRWQSVSTHLPPVYAVRFA